MSAPNMGLWTEFHGAHLRLDGHTSKTTLALPLIGQVVNVNLYCKQS